MKIKILVLILLFNFGSALAQSHSIKFNISYQINETDFFLSDVAQANNATISSRVNLTFGVGFEYKYLFAKKSSSFLVLKTDYSNRNYIVKSTFFPQTFYTGHYVDILLGTGKYYRVKSKWNIGYSVLFGMGLPLREENLQEPGSPNRQFDFNIPFYLPFLEFNGLSEFTYSSDREHNWTIGLNPFFRSYFRPLFDYERTLFEDNAPPYFSFGLTISIGYLRN